MPRSSENLLKLRSIEHIFSCPQNREQRSERNVRDLERGVRSEVWTPETNLRIARVDPRALRRRVGPRKSRFGQLAKAVSHPGKFITFEIIISKLLFDIFQMLYYRYSFSNFFSFFLVCYFFQILIFVVIININSAIFQVPIV